MVGWLRGWLVAWVVGCCSLSSWPGCCPLPSGAARCWSFCWGGGHADVDPTQWPSLTVFFVMFWFGFVSGFGFLIRKTGLHHETRVYPCVAFYWRTRSRKNAAKNPLNGRFASGRLFSVEIIKGVSPVRCTWIGTSISLVSRKYLQPSFGEERTKCVLIVAWFKTQRFVGIGILCMEHYLICLLFLVNLWQAILEAAIQQAAFKFKFRIRNLSFQGVGGWNGGFIV